MIKNNPYDLLKKAGIKPDLMDQAGKRALQAFDDTVKDIEADPDATELKSAAEQLGAEVCSIIEENIQRINGEAELTEAHSETQKVKKHQSNKSIEKANRTLNDLELCRQRLRDDRRKKIESGEIQKPRKKTLTTKLRLELLKMTNLIPKKLKEDTDVLNKTRKAIMKFLNELKAIWGLDRIKPIEDDLIKRFAKLESEADRLAANN